LIVDETFFDEDGSETPLRVVEPDEMRFADDRVTCRMGDGRSVEVQRSEVSWLGINPYRQMPMYVLKDGYSVSVPVGVDPKVAVAWFNRGRARGPSEPK
jgi:hypothetical protein